MRALKAREYDNIDSEIDLYHLSETRKKKYARLRAREGKK